MLVSLAVLVSSASVNLVISENGTDNKDCGKDSSPCASLAGAFAQVAAGADTLGTTYGISFTPGVYSRGTGVPVTSPIMLPSNASVSIDMSSAQFDGSTDTSRYPLLVVQMPEGAAANATFTLSGADVGRFTTDGPVIYIKDDRPIANVASIQVIDSAFAENSAASPYVQDPCGGALGGEGTVPDSGTVSEKESSTFLVKNCLFVENTAINGGGACLFNADVIDSHFEGNQATEMSSPNSNGPCGGGLAVTYKQRGDNAIVKGTLRNVTFKGNYALESGGGLCISRCPIVDGSNLAGVSLDMTDLTFKENSVKGDGGGMYNEFAYNAPSTGNKPKSTCTSCTFDHNAAGDGGGAAKLFGAGTAFKDLVLLDNTASHDMAGGMLVSAPGGIKKGAFQFAPTFAVKTAKGNKGQGVFNDLVCIDSPMALAHKDSLSALCTKNCVDSNGKCACDSCTYVPTHKPLPPADSGGLGFGWWLLIILIIGLAIFGTYKYVYRTRAGSSRATYLAL